MNQQNVYILNNSNPDDPYSCSLCCEKYSKFRPVMKFSACTHIICNVCHNTYPKDKCQHCGANGSYSQNNALTDTATSGIDLKKKQQVNEPNITVNVITQTGATITHVVSRSMKFKELSYDLAQKKGVGIKSCSIGRSIRNLDQHGEMKLSDLQITDNTRIVCIQTFIGGHPIS